MIARSLPRLPALLLALVGVVAACGTPSGSPAGDARTGQPAPAITANAIDGSAVDLAALRGHPIVVNFWASWCVPCRNEFPLFKDRLATLGPSDGLAIIGVLYKDQADLATKFLTDFGATWPSVADDAGTLAAAYRVVAPPQTYFIDKDGVLRGIQIGEVRAEDFATQYAKIKP